MFNIQRKYTSFGCYRFLDDEANTIYVGSSKNIHRRLFSQHFKRGHLPKECYDSTCKIEIIKNKDYATALALEQYLIDKYRPKYNKRDKSKNLFVPTHFENIDYYKKLEKWHLYYSFREYNKNKIKTSRFQNFMSIAITYGFLITIIVYLFNRL